MANETWERRRGETRGEGEDGRMTKRRVDETSDVITDEWGNMEGERRGKFKRKEKQNNIKP